MSETVSRPQAADLVPGRRRSRRPIVVVVVVVVVVALAAGAVAAWRAGAFGSGGSAGPAANSAPPPATAPVVRRDLSQTTPVNAALGYAGSYSVTGSLAGTLTWLPYAGQAIRQGQVLYRVDNGTPVVLLYGTVPDWRAMSAGDTGADVAQLNHDLVRLGYADSANISALGWDYYSWATTYGVQHLQTHLGITDPSGSLSLGSVIFEPAALRVASLTASLGSPATGPLFTATSAQHVVTASLDTSLEGDVAAGDAVTVTLPDGSVTPGVVSSVGTVATASGSGGPATIPVYVRLVHPQAAGSLDQAPVTLNITTSSVSNVLVVPVAALLAQSSGGYAVEVVGAGHTRHLVPVQIGPVFDDTDGLVQVTGALTPGQLVVVPAS